MRHWIILVAFLLCLHACVEAATHVCEAKTHNLNDEIRAVYEARVLCEAKQFKDASCSSFWMRSQRLLRTKFQLQACEGIEAEPWFIYAGSNVYKNGVFEKEQTATSTLVNRTSEDLRVDISNEHHSLREYVETTWEELRTYFTDLITFQWSNTRMNGTLESQNTRDLVSSDYGLLTRTNISQSAEIDRSFITQENERTRNYDSQQENMTREFTTSEHDNTHSHIHSEESNTRNVVETLSIELRTLWDKENDDTVQNTTTNSIRDGNDFRTNAHTEESNARDLIAQTSSITQSLIRSEENETRVQVTQVHLVETTNTISAVHTSASETQNLVHSEAEEVKDGVEYATNEVQDSWSSLSSTIGSLLELWSLGLSNTQNKIFINLLMHVHLQTDWCDLFTGSSLVNSINPVDRFMRSDFIVKMRDITNETIIYNQNTYGIDYRASGAFSQAETARKAGDFIKASAYYRSAYQYAIVP